MTIKNRAVVELRFNDATVITAWKSFTWRDSYTDPLGSLEVTVHPPPNQRDRYRSLLDKGRLIALKLNGHSQATMLITSTETSISKAGWERKASAKSVLATPYEGSVDPYVAQSFDADTTVATVVQAALLPYGFDLISVASSDNLSALTGKALNKQQTDVLVDELKHKDIQAGDEPAYGFAAKIFTRLGTILKVDHGGTLLLVKPDYEQEAAATLLSEGTLGRAGDRFIAEPGITISDTNDGQFSEVVTIGKDADRKGQKSQAAPTHGVKVAGLSRPDSAPFADLQHEEIEPARYTYKSIGGATYKPKFKTDKKARDKDRALNMAKVMHGSRATRAYQIRGAVNGMVSTTGRIWTTGTIARVVIDEEKIDEDMFILECTKSADINGQRTNLTLIPKHALILGEP